MFNNSLVLLNSEEQNELGGYARGGSVRFVGAVPCPNGLNFTSKARLIEERSQGKGKLASLRFLTP